MAAHEATRQRRNFWHKGNAGRSGLLLIMCCWGGGDSDWPGLVVAIGLPEYALGELRTKEMKGGVQPPPDETTTPA